MVNVVTAVADEPPESLMNTLTGYDPCVKVCAPVTENTPATGPVMTPLLVTPSPQLIVAVKSARRAGRIGILECGDGAAEGGNTRDDLSRGKHRRSGNPGGGERRVGDRGHARGHGVRGYAKRRGVVDRDGDRVRPFLGVRVGSEHIEYARQDRIIDDVGDGCGVAVTPDDARTEVGERLRNIVAGELGDDAAGRRSKLGPFDPDDGQTLGGRHRQQAAGFEVLEDLVWSKCSGPPGRVADDLAEGPRQRESSE